mmetsp:Transcript_2458/g.4955  ORF Transcript_2458/g.4955 Transcript_2458/m.4955 type:complete len:201 (-) Transcript_2458:2065-2667(-)
MKALLHSTLSFVSDDDAMLFLNAVGFMAMYASPLAGMTVPGIHSYSKVSPPLMAQPEMSRAMLFGFTILTWPFGPGVTCSISIVAPDGCASGMSGMSPSGPYVPYSCCVRRGICSETICVYPRSTSPEFPQNSISLCASSLIRLYSSVARVFNLSVERNSSMSVRKRLMYMALVVGIDRIASIRKLYVPRAPPGISYKLL